MPLSEQYKAMLDILCKIENQNEMASFLDLILTHKESQEFANRVKILKMLSKKTPQREIARTLKVGISTVTRGSLALNNDRNNSLKKYLC